MGVTIRGTNNIPQLKAALKKLGKKEIKVGVFGHDSNVDEEDINIVTLARVHEFGMTITPKKAKLLTIPINKKAKGKRAADFPTAFMIEVDGIKYLVREKGKDQLEFLFMLASSVTIPERSFLRAGFDENVNEITSKMRRLLHQVVTFKISPDVFCDMIGLEFAGMIQKKLKSGPFDPNHWSTKATKGSSGPLRDTGRLVQSIDYRVE